MYPHNFLQGRSRSLEIGLKVKILSHFQKNNTTSAGFEPARAEPKRFLILRLNHSAKMPQYEFCDIVSKPYGLYFGSCDHIGSGWCSKCSYDVIMCGGPLGGAPSIGVLCSVYKARSCRSSGLGKKEMSLRHKRTKATQQDLSNHILLCKTNGIDYVPHS